MGAVTFLLAFHNHQPVGNFENIFREAFEKCYEPFLGFLEEHPFFRVSLHYSGCLLDWLESREKRFLNRLKRLVKRNQVEMLSGGYYEPILPLIPERDATQQVQFMNRYLARQFGKSPSGLWLTERVWEQKLPRLIRQASLRYTMVDDTHFALAGLAESEIKNFFLTEEEGFPIYLFPIPKLLRYLIPFREAGETLEYLRQSSSQADRPAFFTYADDGEKFGLWPGTFQWVYREGWLERFAEALQENRSWLTLKTFSEVLKENEGQPVPKVYLPSASYEEMTGWSLSREKAEEFAALKRELEASGVWSRSRAFFQGGVFKNFLVKYSEADWMRSRMQQISREVAKIKSSVIRNKSQRELWQSQCNCPYWHGIFGGLYLHHLRRSTYEHLIRAERFCRPSGARGPLSFTEEDLNGDGADEVIMKSCFLAFYFLPHRGGALRELDFYPETVNLLDVLTRRQEAYHRDLIQRWGESGGAGKGKSIHEMDKTVSPEILERAAFDASERFSFLDYFLPSETSRDDFWKGRFHSLAGDPTRIAYSKNWKMKGGNGILTLKATLPLFFTEKESRDVILEKTVEVNGKDAPFILTWKIKNDSKKEIACLYGSEWSFNFFDREKNQAGIRQAEIQDGWSPVHLEMTSGAPFDYWQFPIETVAQTEADFRLIHQGISAFPHWRLSLKPQECFERSLCFSFSSKR